MKKNLKKFYDPKHYKPTKNAVAVEYKGTKYLSKAQCMALEGITRKELDEYLHPAVIAVDPIQEQIEWEEEVDRIVADEEVGELPF